MDATLSRFRWLDDLGADDHSLLHHQQTSIIVVDARVVSARDNTYEVV